MEEKDEVLIKVTLDEQATQERIVEIRKQLTFLRETASGLRKDFENSVISADEFEGGLERIFQQSQILNKELQQQRKALLDNDKQQKANTGSIVEMRAKLSLLTAGYHELSKAERENEDVGGVLQQRIKALSDELKENEEKLGDHRRSVGDYVKGIRIAGTSVGEMQETLKGGVQAVQTFTKGLSVSRGALIALSAVPILILLTGLITLLTKSQAGMDKLAQYAKALDLALTSLTQGFVKIGQATADFFSAETFSSWDKMKEKALAVKDAYFGVADGIKEAARAGVDIEKTNQRIEASEIDLNLTRAKSRAEIERLKLLAEDTTKSNALRSAAAKKAFEIENGLMQQQATLQKERIANAEREYNLSGKTREDLRKLNEEKIKLAEIEEDSLGKQTELQNSLNSIVQDGITKRKEAAALAAQEAIAEAERALIMAKKKGEDTLKIEEEILKRQAKVDNLAADKGAQQRKLIEAKLGADLLALRVQHALDAQAKESRIRESGIESSLALVRRGSEEELKLTVERIRAQGKAEAIENERQLAGEANRVEREIKAGEIAIKTQKAIDDARQQFAVSEVNRAGEQAQARLQTEQDLGRGTLAEIRKIAAARIDQEEKTQLDLLKLEEISEQDRLVKQNAIQARAMASRRELERQLRADVRADEQAEIDIQIAESKSGSSAEFKAKKAQLKLEMQAELDNAELTEKQKAAIRAKYRRAEKDLNEEHTKETINTITNAASQSVNILSTIMQVQSQKLMDELDRQQQFALKAAGTNADLREKIEEKYQKKKAQLEKEAAEKRQKIASVENLINTAKAVTEAAPNVLLMALAAASGLAQQVVIDGQKFQDGGVVRYFKNYFRGDDDSAMFESKFNGGGPVFGPSHGQGGIKMFHKKGAYLGEMEGNEIILTKGVYENPALRAKASALNVAGGGKPFYSTTTTAKPYTFEYGGVAAITNDNVLMMQRFADQINKIQPVLVVDDVNSKNLDRNRVARRVSIK